MHKRVVVGVALVVLATTVFVVSRQDDRPAKAGSPSPTPSLNLLSESEAISVFENLHQQLFSAYRYRAREKIRSFAHPDGPTYDRVREEIDGLLEHDVLSRPTVETRGVEISSITEDEIDLSQRVVSDGRFFSESGREVTKKRRPELQTIEWILRRDGDRWLIFDSLIVRSRRL